MRTLKLIGLLAASALLARGGTLQFTGYLRNGENSRFIVRDVEGNVSSGWLAIGQSFEGAEIVAIETKTEILSVKTAAGILKLPLIDPAKVLKAGPDRVAIQKQVFKNLQMLSSSSEQYFLTKHVRKVAVKDLLEFYKVPLPASVDGEDYSNLVLYQGVMVTAKTQSGMEVTYPEDPVALHWRKEPPPEK